MSVADRLRTESEQALASLQESHRSVKEQLARALSRQQEMDHELASLRAEHRDVCRRLTELSMQQQQDHTELEAVRNRQTDKQAERQDSEEKVQSVTEEAEVDVKEENDLIKDVHHDAETNGSGNMQLTGKGVAEGYLRSLAALEKKKEEGRGPRDPKRIVMLSERSW